MTRLFSTMDPHVRRIRPMLRNVMRVLRWSLPLLLLLAPAGIVSRPLAAESKRRDRTESPQMRETRLTLKARQALFTDSLLAPYNLGVIVRGENVVLQGTLPKTALALRAQERVRGLALFKEVRSELIIDPNDDFPLESPIATQASPDVPGGRPPLSGALMKRDGSPIPIPVMKIGPGTENRGATPPPPVGTDGEPAKDKPPLNEAVTLLAPRPIPDSKSSAAEPPPNILPPGPRTDAKDTSAAVEKLRQSQTRFQSLQVSVRDGIVTIRGGGDDAFTFAQAARTAPGVVRVVINPN